MQLIRKILFVPILVTVFAFFTLDQSSLFAQQRSSSQLLSVAVLPFESDKNPDEYRFVGWGLHYLISSRLQNVPEIYCLSAEEVVNIYPSTLEGSKSGVLETIQGNLSSDKKIQDIYETLKVDILIYGEYNHLKESFELWAKRADKFQTTEFHFREALAEANVLIVLMERIIKLIKSIGDVHSDAFNQFYEKLNPKNPIFAHLPKYRAFMLFNENKEKHKQFRVYSNSWNDYVTAIRNINKCDTFEKKWNDEIKESQSSTRKINGKNQDNKGIPWFSETKEEVEDEKEPDLMQSVDGRVLDGYIKLHNMQLDFQSRQDIIHKFGKALQDNSNLVTAQLGEMKALWEVGKLTQVRKLIGTIKPAKSRHPWFDIYHIALAANEQWDNSNLKAMVNIAERVPWLTTGFDSNRKWATAMQAKFFGERSKIIFMEKVLTENTPDERNLKSIVLSFLYAEMRMRKGEYILAYRDYTDAHNFLKEQDENHKIRRRHLTYFSPWLLDPNFFENKVKQCRHILYKIRLPGSGVFLKFYKHPEIVTAIAQDPNNRSIYAGTNRLNVYRLQSHHDRFEEAVIKREFFLDHGVKDSEKDGIESLEFDQNGNLWILTKISGLFHWNRNILQKSYICADQTSQKKKDLKRISAFLIDDARKLFWISPSAGTIKRCGFKEQNNCFECKPTNVKSELLTYKALLKDRKDRIFLIIDNVIYYYDEGQHEFVALFNSDDHFRGQPIIITAIYLDDADDQSTRLWIITQKAPDSTEESPFAFYNQWLASFKNNFTKKELTFKGPMTPPNGPAQEGFSIKKILPDPQTGLWIGTQKQGLLNIKDNTIFDYNDFLFEGEDVYDLLWDKGLLWIASPKGVRRFNFDTVMTYFNKDGLPGNMVYAIAGNKSGEVYIGTSFGLATYRNGLFEKKEIKDIEKLEKPTISGLLYYSETGLWCRGGNWLHHFPIRNGILEVEGNHLILDDYFTSDTNEIKMEIVADKIRGGVWINTFQGLCFVSYNFQEDPQYLNFPKPTLRPTTPVIDTDQSIWFAHKGNIYNITKEDIEHLLDGKLDNGGIQSILNESRIPIDKNILSSAFGYHSPRNFYVYLIRLQTGSDSKSIWLGTSAGVIEYQPGTKEFKLQNKELGLGHTPIMVTALRFEDDSLWIGSNHGLLRYNFKYRQSSLYDHNYGFQNNTIRSLGFFDKDRIWVGTDDGLATFRLRPVEPLFLNYKLKDLGEKDSGDVEIELMPVFYHNAHKDIRYLVSNKKTGAEIIVSPPHYPSPHNTQKKPEFSLSGTRLHIKGLSPGKYDFSIKALSREFQETPEELALKRRFKIKYPFYMQPWFFALIGLLVLFLILAFYLNTPHARKRFGSRWAAIAYSRKIRKSRDEFIFIIYSIFRKSDAPEKIFEYLRKKTAVGKEKDLAGLIHNYLYLLKLPNTMHNLSHLLKKSEHMKWSQDIGNLYHIISEMLNKTSMADVAGLQLKLDANQYRLESSVCEEIDIPEFIGSNIIKQLMLLDKTLSILAQISTETEYKHQWYYLTAADKTLRDILTDSLQAANSPERNVIINIAKQYSGIVQKEMNRVIAVESKTKEDISDRQIIRHIVKNEYPAPIAYLYSKAQREDNPVIKADFELDLLGLLLRLLTFLVITDYVSISPIKERIDFSKMTRKPLSDGEWNRIFREIITVIGTACQNHSIPQIYEKFSKKATNKLLEELINFRNDIVHRRKRDIQTVSDFNEFMTRLLEQSHFFKDLDLLIVHKISADDGPFKHIEFLQAKGDNLNLKKIKVTTGVSLINHRVVVHNPLENRIINLYPLLRYDHCSLCESHHIYYFTDVSGNRARYLSANTDCINESKAYQRELVDYLNSTSEGKAWIEYHLFKEDKD